MGQGVSTSSGGSASGTSDYCCLEQAGLDCLPVPILIHDVERLLFANGQARALLGISEAHPNLSIDDVVLPAAAEGAAERRRVLLDTGADLGSTRVKAELPGVGVQEVVSRGARICYGDDEHHALVHVVCQVGDATLYEPSGLDAVRPNGQCLPASCLHGAAFESLPVPLAILSHDVGVRFNRAFRTLMRADGPIDGTPVQELVHPDFAEPGKTRRHLVLDLGAPIENSSVKLRGRDGSSLYLTIDAVRTYFEATPYMVTLARQAVRI